MSGAGRKSKFRKSVTDDFLNSFPEPEEGEIIMRVMGTRGANIFEVAARDDDTSGTLALLPNKFKKVIWVKTRDYVLVEGGEESASTGVEKTVQSGNKVRYMIKYILTKEQQKHIQKVGKWPEGLMTAKTAVVAGTDDAKMSPVSNSKVDTGGYGGMGDYGGMDDCGAEDEGEYEDEEDDMVMDKMGNFIPRAKAEEQQPSNEKVSFDDAI
jgi:translation initiation factor IF-1